MPTKDIPELIEDLFQTRRKPNGETYTNVEIAHWIEDNIPGADISPSYISQLRLGDKRNPSRDVLMYFCLAFKVPPTYFFPELSHLNPQEQPDNATMLRTAFRAYGLDDETQKYLEGLIRKIRRLQKPPKERPSDADKET